MEHKQGVFKAFKNAKSGLLAFIWPILGVVFIGVIWLQTSAQTARTLAEGEDELSTRAVSLASSYTKQMAVMIEQIDQITLRMKHEWEAPGVPFDLERVRDLGLFPASPLLYASIYDGAGQLTTSTLLNPNYQTPVDGQPFFQVHRQNCCLGLNITEPLENGMYAEQKFIHFSRRLNQYNGSFGGVAVVSVDPSYLAAFQENVILGVHDFISLRLDGGAMLTVKTGGLGDNLIPIYRASPSFQGNQGTVNEAATQFRDDIERRVAWRKLENYPLVTVAGLSVEDAMAPYVLQTDALQRTAVAQSILVMIFATAGTLLFASFSRYTRHSEETKRTFRLTTDAAKESFYMLRPVDMQDGLPADFEIEDCNNHGADLLGMEREKILGNRVSSLRAQKAGRELLKLLRMAYKRGFIEEEVRLPPNSLVKAKWVYRRIVRSDIGLAVTVRDITNEKMHEQMLADLANTDTLTKLPNRNWLNSFLPDGIAQAAAGTRRLAVLFIDLDNFKNINDTLGHDAGDELLVQVAFRLKEAVRGSDHVVRLGGDEFIIVLEQVEVEEDVERVAKAIILAISHPFPLRAGVGNAINASIGISMYPRDGTRAEELLKHADIAMYAAKAAGKGRYMFYQSHLSDSLILRLDKEQALRLAVERKEFIVYYQPRIDANTGELTSMEALVRWMRPEHGLVYPSEFIDTAEDMGLIVDIGQLVVDQVCTQLAVWKKNGLATLPVSVNISPQQLKAGTLTEYLSTCIKRHGIDPSLVEIELTESAVIDRSITVESELKQLRAMGVKLMIDDFGTGYSSMAQMHRLDVDGLKVDQGFTRALADGPEGLLLYRAILSMAQALDMQVVAEGVETADEFAILQSIHCDEIQGFLISEAVEPAEMTRMILQRFRYPIPPLASDGP